MVLFLCCSICSVRVQFYSLVFSFETRAKATRERQYASALCCSICSVRVHFIDLFFL